MSAGHSHKRPNSKHPMELKKIFSQPSFQEMWARPFTVITDKQIPDSAGYSIKADHYYIDVDLYNQVMSGEISVEGMQPQQILGALLRHERVEKCLMDADNPIDTYYPAHEYATCAEHMGVAEFAPPYKYEDAIEKIIESNETKPLNDVPLDLACAPYVDEPDAHDKRACEQMAKLGVVDCTKMSKETANYSRSNSEDQCGNCKFFSPEPGFYDHLAACQKVAGAVRDTNWCKLYKFNGGVNVEEELDSGGDQEQGGSAQVPGGSGGPEDTGEQGGEGDSLQESQSPEAGQLSENSQGPVS